MCLEEMQQHRTARRSFLQRDAAAMATFAVAPLLLQGDANAQTTAEHLAENPTPRAAAGTGVPYSRLVPQTPASF